jgi:excisionase family DNA binding protein
MAQGRVDSLVESAVAAIAERVLEDVAEHMADPARVAALVDQVVVAAARRVGERATEVAEQLAGDRQRIGLTIAEAARVSGVGQGELRRRCAAPLGAPHRLRHLRVGRRIVIRREALNDWMQEAER